MALTIGSLVAILRADPEPLHRGLTDAELRMRGFTRDVDGRLRTLDGRFASTSALASAGLLRVAGDGDRVGLSLGRLASMAGGLAGLAAAAAPIAAKFGAAVPLAAALVATLANVTPAAAVAVPAVLGLASAVAAVKLATSGVSDAISAAFSASNAAELEEALKGLSPNARSFVLALRDMKGPLSDLKSAVQDRFFDGLDDVMTRVARTTGPAIRDSLLASADSLNAMARGAGEAAAELGENGTLGRALDGGNDALREMEGIPGLVVTALGQLGAAAAPALRRLTGGVAEGTAALGDRITGVFESGGMQAAIEHALDILGQMADIGGNVASTIRSIFSAAQMEGGGMLGVLQEVSAALADAFASPEVQSALRALFGTMQSLAVEAAPLLMAALSAIAPVLTTLGPPVQRLIADLADGLRPVLEELGEGGVMEALAGAIGLLIDGISPMLPIVGELIALLGPPLALVFEGVGQMIADLSPRVQDLVTQLAGDEGLKPVLELLPQVVTPLMDILIALIPILEPVIALAGALASVLSENLVRSLEEFVIPALEAVAALLQGDWDTALERGKAAAAGFVTSTVANFAELPGRAASAVASLGDRLWDKMWSAGGRMLEAAQQMGGELAAWFGALPGVIVGKLGDLGGLLVEAGRDAVRGLISGVRAMIPDLGSVIGGIADTIVGGLAGALDIHSPSRVMRDKIGKWIPAGLIEGIQKGAPALKTSLEQLSGMIADAVEVSPKSQRGGLRELAADVARDNRRLLALAVDRDRTADRLAAAEKKLGDLRKAATGLRDQIAGRIADESDITESRTVESLTARLQRSVQSTAAFAADLATLRKSGLRADLLEDIAGAGVDGGAATARALAAATPAQIKQINALQQQLVTSADRAGASVSKSMYGAGVAAAEGVVAGLKSQEKQIERQMERLAESMVKAIRKAPGIKSPSTVMRESVGRHIPAGIVAGIAAGAPAVERAMRGLVRVPDMPGVMQLGDGRGFAPAAVPQAVDQSTTYHIYPQRAEFRVSDLDALTRRVEARQRVGRAG
ncbi:phage tail protein [Streptomyces sp. URMC 129]|uniref:phage tail protein n=1 Tax=Streptomyces sp. URMC 129 TaxID=3423407 RepID=UPI003F1C0C1B